MTMDKHAENGPTRKNGARKDKKDASLHNIRKSIIGLSKEIFLDFVEGRS